MQMRTVLFILVIVLTACQQKPEKAQVAVSEKYTCPMHPQILQDKPGTCPVCGMDLVKVSSSSRNDQAIMLSETQIKLANITTTLTRRESLGESTILNGRLTVNEDETEVISSRAQGRIEKLYIREVGQGVSKGQKLYDLYSEQLLTLQKEYLLAARQLEELKGERYQSFLSAAERKLILLGMTTQQVAALARTGQTNATISFLSPISGVIGKIDVTEGQYVNEGSALYRIEQLERLWVEVDLYPGEASLVKMGDRIKVLVGGFENSPVEGTVSFLNPEYRSGSQIVTLRAILSNPSGQFRPGMFATIFLTRSQKQVLALPSDAVIHDGNGAHVWVLDNDGAFRPRMVKTGMETFEKTEVTEGITEKENVVITGAYLLYGELVLKRGIDPMAGHHH